MLPLIEAVRASVRETLGADAFDEAFASGQQFSLAEAYAPLLEPVRPV
jgi:hypothetical protein